MSVSYKALSISFGVIKCVAVILTIFRLGYRLRTRRFWWEDTWAGVALLCMTISIITVYSVSWTNSYESIFIANKIDTYMFTSVVWSVRLSHIFSIVRVAPSAGLRRITLVVAASFFVLWAITLGLQSRWCVVNTQTFPEGPRLGCVTPTFIIIFEIATNCGSDMVAAIFPLKFLWRVKLPPRQRRMILSLFLASRFLCLFSLARLITQVVGAQSIQVILANTQLGVFLIGCNLLVVVTYVYRVLCNPSDEELPSTSGSPAGSPLEHEDDDFTTPAPRSRSIASLTTVDLELSSTDVSEPVSEPKGPLFPILIAPGTTERYIAE